MTFNIRAFSPRNKYNNTTVSHLIYTTVYVAETSELKNPINIQHSASAASSSSSSSLHSLSHARHSLVATERFVLDPNGNGMRAAEDLLLAKPLAIVRDGYRRDAGSFRRRTPAVAGSSAKRKLIGWRERITARRGIDGTTARLNRRISNNIGIIGLGRERARASTMHLIARYVRVEQ